MPRPVQQRVQVRAAPEQAPGSPTSGVYAPVSGVRAAPASGTMAGLVSALGPLLQAGMPIAKTAVAVRAKHDEEAGAADAALGQVDPKRAKASILYADAAHRVSVIKQFDDAQNTVTSRAATDLDHSLPYQEQVKQIDAWMKEQLGPLAQDAKAAAVIAPRYQHFIETAATNIVEQQAQARYNEARDATRSDLGSAIANGGLTPELYGQYVDTLTHLSGDRTTAVADVVSTYGDAALDIASKGGDWKAVFKAIPTSIKLADGTTIPGPTIGGGKNHDAIVRAQDAAQRAYNAHMEPKLDIARASLYTHLDSQARAGALITLKGLQPYLEPGKDGTPPLLSPVQAAGYIDAAARKREELAKKAAARDVLLLGDGWQRYLGSKDASGKVITKHRVQEQFDELLNHATENFTSKGSVDTAIAAGQRYNLPSTSLKAQLTTVASPTSAKAAVTQLATYEKIKAAGQTAMYLTPDQTTFYENLAVRQKAGATPDDLVAAASRYRPEELTAVVNQNLPKAVEQFSAAVAHDNWGPFNTKFSDYSNTAQVNAAATQQLRVALADNGGNIPAAVKAVQESMQQHWAPLDLGENKVLIPKNAGVDPSTLQDAVTLMSTKWVKDMAKSAGADQDLQDRATWQATSLPGQGTELEVIDPRTGIQIPGTPRLPLQDVLRKAENVRTKQSVQAMHEAQQRTKDRQDMISQHNPYQGTPLYMTH